LTLDIPSDGLVGGTLLCSSQRESGGNFMRKTAAALFVGGMMLALSLSSYAKDKDKIKHVLLISVDGLHALDLSNYVAANPGSTLAYLSGRGVTYSNASTSQPSDSFPGLASLVTGGSPITSGLWYDVSYNRKLATPLSDNPATIGADGNPAGPCTPGAQVWYDESDDYDLRQLDGAGGIDPAFLPRDPSKIGCPPVYPHQYLRVNTIFEVVKENGGRTAWTDKHPSYEWTNGPSGKGVDDFYGPEINSIPVALAKFPGIPTTAPFPTCTPLNFPDTGIDDGWTTNLLNIMCYDETHVQAVLNQIDGWNHNHTSKAGVPTLFGTNFQSVSVGEKLKGNGYSDVLGTPSAGLKSELDFVDASLGLMVAELRKQDIYDSTLIIIGAKHGQSPIDVTKRDGIGGGQPGTLISTLDSGEAFDISDDGSLIWLNDQTQTDDIATKLSETANQTTLGIQEIFAGDSLKNKWNDPTVDPRTPDIILKVNTGVIFTGGGKIAEHGGLNEDDVHVALLVSQADMHGATVHFAVSNQQVAPTIVQALGYDPNELQAVQKEQVHVLPFLFEEKEQH
jgi:predicted AlkP superfamily pyrophosphatase or phosphodiesterase